MSNGGNRGLAAADAETRARVASEGGSQNTEAQQEARRRNIKKAQEARSNNNS